MVTFKALCIGGTFDGRWREYDPDRPYMVMSVPGPAPKVTASMDEFPEPVRMRLERYRREQIATPEETFTVLVASDLPIHLALRRLIIHYNPPIQEPDTP